jgi:hypothetical protein
MASLTHPERSEIAQPRETEHDEETQRRAYAKAYKEMQDELDAMMHYNNHPY